MRTPYSAEGPNGPLRPFEVDTAIRDALAVYYYPGMWNWPRKVVERGR